MGFRSATGEAWQEIMYSIETNTKCDPESRTREESEDNCSSKAAIPYFLSFVMLCTFLVMFNIK